MRSLTLTITNVIITAFFLLLGGCASSSSSPVKSPSWENAAVGGECEMAAVLALGEAGGKEGKDSKGSQMLGVGMIAARALSPVAFPSGKRIEICVRLKDDRNDIDDWLVVVRGVPKDDVMTLILRSAGKPLASGAVVIGKYHDNQMFLWPETWVLASREASQRVAAFSGSDVSSPMSLPSGVVLGVALRGPSARQIARDYVDGHYKTTDDLKSMIAGMTEMNANVGFVSEGLETRVRVSYESDDRARDVKEQLTTAWRRAGEAIVDGNVPANGAVAQLAKIRRVATLDVSRDGSVVLARLILTSDVIELLLPGGSTTASSAAAKLPLPGAKVPPASPSSYVGTCPPNQRFDLDQRVCVSQ